jgi:hypothetical protein
MKRILCSLPVATLPFGSVLADAPKSKNAKVTIVLVIPLLIVFKNPSDGGADHTVVTE